ncbi:hypothetical protein ACQ4M4_11285 [Leptolyngbya sp. AN02str]|uniref:hypothetical protein n=1 Tax=Leptolyngbya sp. AN02str TaxID=3423363 RepID=UPI003D31606E
MAKSRGIESFEGVTKRSGLMIPVGLLRFNPSNIRQDYGFVNEEVCSMVRGQIQVLQEEATTLTDEEIEFVRQSSGSVDDDQSILWLAHSISTYGVQSEIKILSIPGSEEVKPTDGNRRLMAMILAKLLGLTVPERVPAAIEPWKDEFGVLKRQMVSNQGARRFNPLEEARLFQRAVDLGKTLEEIAEELANGRTIQYVRLRLQLLDLPLEAQKIVQSGQAKATPILQVFQENTDIPPDEILHAVQEAVAETQSASNGASKKASKAKIQAKLAAKGAKSGASSGSTSGAAPEEEGERDSIIDALDGIISAHGDQLPIADLRSLLKTARKMVKDATAH